MMNEFFFFLVFVVDDDVSSISHEYRLGVGGVGAGRVRVCKGHVRCWVRKSCVGCSVWHLVYTRRTLRVQI